MSQTDQLIKPELQDFWKTLWHVDVKKDHSRSYDAHIVNNYLPNKGKYITTQQTANGKYISRSNERASREGLEFTDLFLYLTGKSFSDIRDLPIGESTLIELNPSLLGTPEHRVKYDIKVFSDNGQGLSGFLTNDVCVFVDTASHLPELITNYRRSSPDKAFYYTYTREIESDPADKITYESIGSSNQSSFYYELPPPENSRIICYPSFKSNIGLSYFYCNNDIFLRYDRIRDTRKYKFSVELSFRKSDTNTVIVVKDGANIAGALERVTTGIRELFGFGIDAATKEMVFIAKHHGDVAQTLTKFRDINLRCPEKPTQKINTTGFTNVFVSIDINAIIKALTVGVQYIIMYPPDKKRIIVWKNQNLSTPKELFESQKLHILNLNEKLRDDCTRYNEAVDKVNRQKDIFDKIILTKLSNEFRVSNTSSISELVEKYRELIKFGIRVVILSKYIPNQKLEYLESVDFNFEREIIAINLSATPSNDEIRQKRKQLEKIQTKIHSRQNKFIIPAEYTDFIIVNEDTNELVTTDLEKEILLDFEELRMESRTITAKLLPPYESIDLEYILGENELASRVCRITTKLHTSWGMDFLTYIYNNFDLYDDAIASLFINVIRNLLIYNEDKLKTFSYILDINNIIVEWKLPDIIDNTQQSIASWLTRSFGALTSRLLSFVSSAFGFRTNTQVTNTAGIKRLRNGGTRKHLKVKGRGRVTVRRTLPDGLEPFQKSFQILVNDIYEHCIFLKHFLESQKTEQINTDNQQKILLQEFSMKILSHKIPITDIQSSITNKTTEKEKVPFDTNKSFLLAFNVVTSYEDLLNNIEYKLPKYGLKETTLLSQIEKCRGLIRDIYNFPIDESMEDDKDVVVDIIETVSKVSPVAKILPPGGDENEIMKTPIKAVQVQSVPINTPKSIGEADDMENIENTTQQPLQTIMTPGGENYFMTKTPVKRARPGQILELPIKVRGGGRRTRKKGQKKN